MSNVSTNYITPTILDSLTPAAHRSSASNANLKANSTSTSSSTSSTSADGGLGTNFLSLLAQELQNQDPTAPIDPTAMVGQMISLNQLEQLISINQAITGSSTTTGTTAAAVQATGKTANGAAATSAKSGSRQLSPTAASAVTSQLPFDPNTMMPIGFSNTQAATEPVN